jgi:uncharacterized protein YjbI with pentapeptide repeats
MAITLFGRGIPLSAVDDGSTLSVAYNGAALLDITSAGISAGTGITVNTTTFTATTFSGTNVKVTTVTATTVSGAISADTVKATTITGTNISAASYSGTTVCATTVQGTTICGSTANSAVNLACTFVGGSSASTSGAPATIQVCADAFLKMTINSKTYYVPAFASAGAFTAA